MPEFVAECTDAVDAAAVGTVEFVEHQVFVHAYAVEVEGSGTVVVVIVVRVGKEPLVRPYVLAVVALRFAVTGIDDGHHFAFPVSIPVVVGKVDALFVSRQTGICHHFARVRIATRSIVLAVVAHLLGHGNGAHDVEVHLELSV